MGGALCQVNEFSSPRGELQNDFITMIPGCSNDSYSRVYHIRALGVSAFSPVIKILKS